MVFATLQAQVFQAQDRTTGQVVAVKKSGVSLRVRTLYGHPAILLVFAVGQFKHFEYRSVELFGPSIADFMGQTVEIRKKIAPRVAAQMMYIL
jgi:hypothetical protein